MKKVTKWISGFLSENGQASSMPAGGQVHKAEVVEEKKGGGDWLFWGIVGTIGLFVGVNLFKNRN